MLDAITSKAGKSGNPGMPPVAPHVPLIPIVPFGMSLSLFFVITYVACVVFYLTFPVVVQTHTLLSLFLPGFRLLDWPSFFLGLVESFGYGWYVALIFGPLFNYFSARKS